MVDGRLRNQWEQTAWLTAAVFNAQPGRKSSVKPRSVNPYRGLLRSDDPGVTNLDDVFGIE